MSYETRYAARKRQAMDARADTPEAIEARRVQNEVNDQVRREAFERFGEVTVVNAKRLAAFMIDRYRELMRDAGYPNA